MKLVSIEEMRAIEDEANSHGLTYEEMMENAGHGLANKILALDLQDKEPSAIGLVGAGNNGGDTLVALTELANAGWKTIAYQVLSRKTPDPLSIRFEEAGGEILQYDMDKTFLRLDAWMRSSQVLLDGVLGTGSRLVLSPELSELLAHISTFSPRPFIVAVDCPSGVDCNSGSAAVECIPADITVCMGAIKEGLVKFPAYELVGHLDVVDLGLPDDLEAWEKVTREVVSEETVRKIIPFRRMDAHKGTFGTAMIVAGSINYTGAPLLAAKAAYRIGAGLVRLAIPESLYTALAGHIPEATWLLLPNEMGVISAGSNSLLLNNLQNVTGLLLGPGWGVEKSTEEFLRKFLTDHTNISNKGNIGFIASNPGVKEDNKVILPPIVVDADGLKLLARIDSWFSLLPPVSVLTPHPGEMAILTGLEIKDVQNDRIAVAQEYSNRWGHIVVLKGALTVIAEPRGRISIIPIATSALARAGTGDVLAGMIVGMLAQGIPPFLAAVAATWMHAQAGLHALEYFGHSAPIMAGDLLDLIADVFPAD